LSGGFWFEPAGSTLLVDSSSFPEEVAQETATIFGENPAAKFGSMIKPLVGADLVDGLYRPGLGIGGAVDEASDSSEDDGPGAHAARFKGYDERAFVEAAFGESFCGMSNGSDFCVSGRIVVGFDEIMGFRNDFTIAVNECSDRNLADGRRFFRQFDRSSHQRDVDRGRFISDGISR